MQVRIVLVTLPTEVLTLLREVLLSNIHIALCTTNGGLVGPSITTVPFPVVLFIILTVWEAALANLLTPVCALGLVDPSVTEVTTLVQRICVMCEIVVITGTAVRLL